ncbi:MAG: TIGR03862 family flavoprotein [Gammaproteobacteria bacterium]|nr:TIGR03862 family flavoprotein [Gammaproteobacteria bacterium]
MTPDNAPIAIIGAGPAGLMAAEVLSLRGHAVAVYDAMPSPGRKFLLAGVGGMNITHAESPERFLARYAEASAWLAPHLEAFGASALRDWVHGLGIETFVGSSGRVFPKEMKAAPLLRAWLRRLREQGVVLMPRHRWLGFAEDGALRFATPEGETRVQARAVLLALGGGSWPKLGSDGAWQGILRKQGVSIAPLVPANCGFEAAWSEHLKSRHAGQPVKPVLARCRDTDGRIWEQQGEFVLTGTGIEGGLIYALSAPLRRQLERDGEAWLSLDLLPGKTAEQVLAECRHPRGARSLSSQLQSRLNLKGVKMALLRECLSKADCENAEALAAGIKNLPLRLTATRPLPEAISSAGGVLLGELDDKLMLKKCPGLFCAGEMLDWEAPTGGYLLTACFATGRAAGLGLAAYLKQGRLE